MSVLPMENPEGVGLVTAMAISGGFILLSSLIDRTLSRLLNNATSSSSSPSRTFTRIINRRGRRPAPSTHTDVVNELASPVNSDHRNAADPLSNLLAAGNHLETKEAHERVAGGNRQIMDRADRDVVITADYHHAISSQPSSHDETAPRRRRFHVRRARHHPRHNRPGGGRDGAGVVIGEQADAAAAAAEAAVAAMYRHGTNEPCSLVTKYLQSGAPAVNYQLLHDLQDRLEPKGADDADDHATNRSSRRRTYKNSIGRTYNAEHELESAVTRRPPSHHHINHSGDIQAHDDDREHRPVVTASKRHVDLHRTRYAASSISEDPRRQLLQKLLQTQSEAKDSDQQHQLQNHHLLETSRLISSSTSVRLMAGSGRNKKVRFSPNTEDPLREQRKYRCRHDIMQAAAQEIGTDCEYHGQSIITSGGLAAPRYVGRAGQARGARQAAA